MEAKAKHTFTATAPDELSFHKNDNLMILKCDGENHWFKAELNGQEGFIPENYIDFDKPEYFISEGKRQVAEEKLMTKNERGEYTQPDGAFLLRPSETAPGHFSLSVKWGESVQHFKVLRDEHGKFHLWEKKFDTLNELVKEHRSKSVSRTQTILLKDMVKCAGRFLYVKATYDFEAADETELSFRKSDELKILSKPDEYWWKAELNGNSGLIPVNYIAPIYKR